MLLTSTRPCCHRRTRLVPNQSLPFFASPTPAPHNLTSLLALHKRWEARKYNPGEHDTHGAHVVVAGSSPETHVELRLRCADARAGKALLSALQDEVYEAGEKGCQLRRESQAKTSLVCDAVTVLVNDAHHEASIRVALGSSEAAADWTSIGSLLARLETRAHAALTNH